MQYLLCFSLWLTCFAMNAQTVLPLYPDEIPNSKNSSNQEKKDTVHGTVLVRKISIPTLTIYLPKGKRTATAAVIICPGGGYWVNAIKHEGTDVAEKFA